MRTVLLTTKKTVLLTTNLTNNSRTTNEYAIRFFGTEVEYVLLYGYTIDYAKLNRNSENESSENSTLDTVADQLTMDKLIEEQEFLKGLFKNLKIRSKLRRGIGITAIEAYCNQMKPDVAVVGTNKFTDENRTNKTSVATRLIGSIDTPILVIPYELKFERPHKFLYAYDTIEFNNLSMELLMTIFHGNKPKLTFLHIKEDDEKRSETNFLEGLARLLNLTKVNDVSIDYPDVVSGILNYFDEFEFEMLIVTARKESYLQDFWTGSKVDRLATHLRKPMLVLTD